MLFDKCIYIGVKLPHVDKDVYLLGYLCPYGDTSLIVYLRKLSDLY